MTTTPNPGQPTDAAPCPFCGGTDGSVQEGSTFRWMRWSCDCGVVGPEVRVQRIGHGSLKQWKAEAQFNAIKAWNTRALLATKASASDADQRDAELWRKWLPYLSKPSRKPYNLARDIETSLKVQAQQAIQGREDGTR